MDDKVVFAIIQQPIAAHFGKFTAQGTAFDTEIVGKLLAVEGDVEHGTARPLNAFREIGREPPPNGFGGGVQYAAGKAEVFGGAGGKQIAQKAFAGLIGWGGGDRSQEQNRCVLDGAHPHHQRFIRYAGIGFRKNLAGQNMSEQHMVAPHVVVADRGTPGQYDAQPLGRRTLGQDHGTFGVTALGSLQTA